MNMKYTPRKVQKLALCLVWMLVSQSDAQPFRIVQQDQSVPIIFDQNDADVVGVAGEALAGDIEFITGIQPSLFTLAKKRMLVLPSSPARWESPR
jgi:hypothetical protein